MEVIIWIQAIKIHLRFNAQYQLYKKNGVTKSPNSVIDQLSDCNVKPISEIKPKVGDCYVYAIAEAKMRGWYLDDILHVMFSKARPYFEDIKK